MPPRLRGFDIATLWRSSGEGSLADRIPIFPLHTLLLPQTDLGLHVFEVRYRALVSQSLGNGHTFGVVLIKQAAECYDVGTLAHIAGYARLPDGRYLLEVEGTKRFRIEEEVDNGSYPMAKVSWLPETIGNFGAARSAAVDVTRLFRLYRMRSGDGDLPVHLPKDPVSRSYLVASLLRIDTPEKQRLLEMETAEERLDAEHAILRRELLLLDHLRMQR
jgi:Lon protease-like protein